MKARARVTAVFLATAVLLTAAYALCPSGASCAQQSPATSCYATSHLTPPELLPTGHWAYEELRKLWVQGLVDSFFVSTEPVSRYDVAELLISLQESSRPAPNSPALQRLLREFSREMRDLEGGASGGTSGAGATGYGANRETSGATAHAETPFLFQKQGQNLDFRFSLYADATADNWDTEDMELRDGARAGFQAWVLLRPNIVLFEDIYVGKLSGGWRYGEELFSLKDVLILSDRFYISLRAPFIDVTLGRDKLRWGPGRTGTLLLSDAASSYTLLSASKAFGRKLKISTVSGILDSEEGKYLAGHRIDIAPSNSIQIGFAETAIYHSRFVEPLYAISLVPFTLVERTLHRDSQDSGADDPARNNVGVSTDLVVRACRGVSLYGEFMLDDWAEETSKRPTKLAYQLGTAMSKSTGGRTFNAIAELSRVWNYTYSVSYSDVYDRDASHQGLPLGYCLGPDSKRVFLLLSCDVSRDFELGLSWDEILKGEGELGQPWREEMGMVNADKLSGIVETKRSIAPFVRWLPRDNVLIEASAGLKQIENKNHVEKEDESGALFSLRLAARW
ncbi:MAG: hypothetical protein NTX17_06375 [Candidatus Eisenbacteria bacterium]|nr:hypothetical protein [Candidatus Eisenbacteria bacterium]